MSKLRDRFDMQHFFNRLSPSNGYFAKMMKNEGGGLRLSSRSRFKVFFLSIIPQGFKLNTFTQRSIIFLVGLLFLELLSPIKVDASKTLVIEGVAN